MEHTQEVALRLTQEELLLTHSALCDYRARLGNMMGQMAGMGLSTAEAQTLSNRLGAIAARLRSLTND